MLDLHDKNVIVAHWQRAVTFVGHSSRRVQRAVLISFVCRLCWHAAGLSFAVLSCNLRCSCDGRWQRYFPTALRWPDNGRHTCARSPYLTLPYGSRVLLRGDFGPSRCVCVSDSSDLELILSAPSVGTVGRVVWTARDLGQERPGGRRKVRHTYGRACRSDSRWLCTSGCIGRAQERWRDCARGGDSRWHRTGTQ